MPLLLAVWSAAAPVPKAPPAPAGPPRVELRFRPPQPDVGGRPGASPRVRFTLAFDLDTAGGRAWRFPDFGTDCFTAEQARDGLARDLADRGFVVREDGEDGLFLLGYDRGDGTPDPVAAVRYTLTEGATVAPTGPIITAHGGATAAPKE